MNSKKILQDFYRTDASLKHLSSHDQIEKFNLWAKHNRLNYRLVIKKNDSKVIRFLLWTAIGMILLGILPFFNFGFLVFLKLLALPILIYVSINMFSKPRIEEVDSQN